MKRCVAPKESLCLSLSEVCAFLNILLLCSESLRWLAIQQLTSVAFLITSNTLGFRSHPMGRRDYRLISRNSWIRSVYMYQVIEAVHLLGGVEWTTWIIWYLFTDCSREFSANIILVKVGCGYSNRNPSKCLSSVSNLLQVSMCTIS